MEIIITGIIVSLLRVVTSVLATIRTTMMVRGEKKKTIMFGGVELLIYTVVASQAFKYVTEPFILGMYVLGYCLGTYIGMIIGDRMNLSILQTTIITEMEGWSLADELRQRGYGVTTSISYGMNGVKKKQLIVVHDSKEESSVSKITEEHDPKAYVFTVGVKREVVNSVAV